MSRYTKAEVAEAREMLTRLCPPGTKVYTVLRHVSRSGMLRHISLFVMHEGDIRPITWSAARVLGYPLASTGHHALKVGGAGMDMGFHVVHSLSYALHGYPEHTTWEQTVKEQRKPNRPGYSLTHEWL
jgi:hypothetical protein